MAIPAENSRSVLATGEETGGRFALIAIRARKGTGPPRHVHSREDELVYVLDGTVVFERDGERVECAAGSCLSLPRAVEHSYRVESDEARMLAIVYPAGFEGYVHEMNEPGGATEIEHAVVVAARYGIQITGPRVASQPMNGAETGADPEFTAP